jgi:hypothetical protein
MFGFESLYYRLDMNLDGAFSISDLYLLAKQIACQPGNFFLELLAKKPWIANFFEIHMNARDGFGSAFGGWAWGWSVVFWLLIFGAIHGAIDDVRQHGVVPK